MSGVARPWPERLLEQGLFGSRWLLAPFYAGLVGALVLLLVIFGRELVASAARVMTMSTSDAILAVLTLVDLSLAANLLLIVIFSGYETFVGRMTEPDPEQRPDWMGTVDFSGLKLKLIASIVAISAIHLLQVFMSIEDYPAERVMLLLGIHVALVLSGLMLALMDWIVFKSDPATRAAREKSQHEVEAGDAHSDTPAIGEGDAA